MGNLITIRPNRINETKKKNQVNTTRNQKKEKEVNIKHQSMNRSMIDHIKDKKHPIHINQAQDGHRHEIKKEKFMMMTVMIMMMTKRKNINQWRNREILII